MPVTCRALNCYRPPDAQAGTGLCKPHTDERQAKWGDRSESPLEIARAAAPVAPPPLKFDDEPVNQKKSEEPMPEKTKRKCKDCGKTLRAQNSGDDCWKCRVGKNPDVRLQSVVKPAAVVKPVEQVVAAPKAPKVPQPEQRPCAKSGCKEKLRVNATKPFCWSHDALNEEERESVDLPFNPKRLSLAELESCLDELLERRAETERVFQKLATGIKSPEALLVAAGNQ